MSNPQETNTHPVTSFEQLVSVLAEGAKPKPQWRIGTEHEKFGFLYPAMAEKMKLVSFASPSYQPGGIQAMLEGMEQASPLRWGSILDQDNLIGLKGLDENKGRSISLEPAGQFELSGAPVAHLHATRAELQDHFEEIRKVASPLGLGFSPLGFHPTHTQAEMPWMPKSRYAIMRRYMPQVGSLGLDMMTRTCTVQVNLDFSSEEDMRQKMLVSLAFQPLASALFANSPFYEGKPNGYLSNRARIWTDTDNQRSGMPDLFFTRDFGFAAYVNWVLDVPMYFIIRDGRMIDVAGCSFRAWIENKHQAPLDGYFPTVGDFEDHLTTVFPDVRLKQFLEMRGADAGTPEMMLAQSAFWVGLLYDEAVLKEAVRLASSLAPGQCQEARAMVPAAGMDTILGSRTLREWSRILLNLSQDGLKARAIMNGDSLDESCYLAPLFAIAHGGPTLAEHWLQRFLGPWQGKVERIFWESEV